MVEKEEEEKKEKKKKVEAVIETSTLPVKFIERNLGRRKKMF